eukprot:8930713-Pyramimonas_sp.AAC.1
MAIVVKLSDVLTIVVVLELDGAEECREPTVVIWRALDRGLYHAQPPHPQLNVHRGDVAVLEHFAVGH